jgi:hypothetical protein
MEGEMYVHIKTNRDRVTLPANSNRERHKHPPSDKTFNGLHVCKEAIAN